MVDKNIRNQSTHDTHTHTQKNFLPIIFVCKVKMYQQDNEMMIIKKNIPILFVDEAHG